MTTKGDTISRSISMKSLLFASAREITLRLANMNAVGFETERIGIERNPADGGRAAELSGELLLGDMTN